MQELQVTECSDGRWTAERSGHKYWGSSVNNVRAWFRAIDLEHKGMSQVEAVLQARREYPYTKETVDE